MTSENKKEHFSTRDLGLAAVLTTLRFYMCGIDYQIEGDKNVGYFIFEDSEELKKAIRKYQTDELAVEPRKLMSNIRSLKAEINNVYKNPRQDLL